jgi:ATP-binding cassette subfamily B protein
MTEQFQQGVTGFGRFMDIMEVEPEIQDSANALEIKNIQGTVEF